LAHIDLEKWENEKGQEEEETYLVPDILTDALNKNKKAADTFSNLAPSYKRHYIGWISSAKKEETKTKRLREAISYLEQGKKLPMK
jgi:uncharacterized protein YdeI (YjbR/CyaY-like superfamily)